MFNLDTIYNEDCFETFKRIPSQAIDLIFEKEASAGRAFSKSFFNRGEMTDIWRMKRGENIEGHGATFPLHLAQKAITGWSAPDETILDPFMGTGTSLIAARNEGRKAVGIEISEEYCELAVKGLAQMSLFTLPNTASTRQGRAVAQNELFG